MKPPDIDLVGRILMSLPDVQERTIHGYRSFKTRGKLLACPAIHESAEPDSLVVKLPAAERDRLLAERPRTCYVTDHYAGDAVVLIRLSKIDEKALRSLLERAWGLLNRDRRSVGARRGKTTRAGDSVPRKSRTSRSTRSRVRRAR